VRLSMSLYYKEPVCTTEYQLVLQSTSLYYRVTVCATGLDYRLQFCTTEYQFVLQSTSLYMFVLQSTSLYYRLPVCTKEYLACTMEYEFAQKFKGKFVKRTGANQKMVVACMARI
jgi:hypothetical protein